MYVHTRIASHSLNNASEKFLSFCNVNNNQSRESFSKIFPKVFKTRDRTGVGKVDGGQRERERERGKEGGKENEEERVGGTKFIWPN